MTDDPARIGPVIDPAEDMRIGFRMIRETVERFAPPGSLPQRPYTGIRMSEEAEALCRAIAAIAADGRKVTFQP